MLSEIKSQHLSVCLLPTNSHLVQRHTTWDDECDTNFLIQFSEKKRLSTFPSNLLSSTAGGGWCEERKGSSESENTGKGKSVFVSESQIPGSQGCHSLSTRVPGKRFDMPQLIRSPFFLMHCGSQNETLAVGVTCWCNTEASEKEIKKNNCWALIELAGKALRQKRKVNYRDSEGRKMIKCSRVVEEALQMSSSPTNIM